MLTTGEDYVKMDPTFKKLWDNTMAFQYMMDAYFDLQNPRYGPTYPGNKETYPGFTWQ
jgi:hypothetical protein